MCHLVVERFCKCRLRYVRTLKFDEDLFETTTKVELQTLQILDEFRRLMSKFVFKYDLQ